MTRTFGLVLLFTSVAWVPNIQASDNVADRNVYVGLALGYKSDGSIYGRDNLNPLTSVLTYLPVALEAGYFWHNLVGGHASLGYGLVSGDETGGNTYELLVGPDLQTCPNNRVCFGVRLDAGYAHLSYSFEIESTSFGAFLLEPKAMVAIGLGSQRLWQIRFLPGARFKWITGEEERFGFQSGLSVSVAIVRRF